MPRMLMLSGTVETKSFSKAYYADREAQGNLEVIGNLTIILIILNSHWLLHFWEAAFLGIILRGSFKMNVHYSINLLFSGIKITIFLYA
jgi:hypothetical protein